MISLGAGVVEAFAGFVFDGPWIGFQPVNVLAEAGVFRRERFDLFGQGFVFGALLLPACDTVASVDRVPGKKQGKEHRGYRADAAAVA